MWKNKRRRCDNCRKSFIAKRSFHVYCSTECRTEAHWRRKLEKQRPKDRAASS